MQVKTADSSHINLGNTRVMTAPSRPQESPQPEDTFSPNQRDSFLDNIGQFARGMTPVRGLMSLANEANTFTDGAKAAVIMGQGALLFFAPLAGLMHSVQGLQAAAIGYGVAGAGALAAGIAHSMMSKQPAT